MKRNRQQSKEKGDRVRESNMTDGVALMEQTAAQAVVARGKEEIRGSQPSVTCLNAQLTQVRAQRDKK
jgi:hypothetical protein